MMYKSPHQTFPNGFRHYPNYFSPAKQQTLIECVKRGVLKAPFYQPTMPRTGTPLSVVMSNFGPLGWVTDKYKGYRYEDTHPKTGAPWPDLPELLGALWDHVTDYPVRPEATLINWYKEDKASKMGMHVDNDENDLRAPGEARLCHHGVSKVYYGESALVPRGGRINLTMRRVNGIDPV